MKNAFSNQCSEITHFSYYKNIRKERLVCSDLGGFVLRKKIYILEKQMNKLIQCLLSLKWTHPLELALAII